MTNDRHALERLLAGMASHGAEPPLPDLTDAAGAEPPLPDLTDAAGAEPPLPDLTDAAGAEPPLPDLTDAAGAEPPLPDLTDAAAAAGLLDVAYASIDSPVGRILLAGTERGLVRLAYLDDGDEDAALEDLAARISPRVLSAPRRLDEPRRELDEYFSGRRRGFELPLDWRLTRGFGRRVLQATARIPYGLVSSYKVVATEAGSPRGFRAAGNALGSNPLPIVVPCHRVLHADGRLGGYTGGLERKQLLLAIEGREAV